MSCVINDISENSSNRFVTVIRLLRMTHSKLVLSLRRLVGFLFWFGCFSLVLIGAEPSKRNFDLPAGNADQALKRLSEQSGREVLFPADAVEGVKTKAVRGQMTPQEALDAMLAGTPLV